MYPWAPSTKDLRQATIETMELEIEESIDIGCLAMEIVLSEQFMTTQFEENQFIPSMTSKPDKGKHIRLTREVTPWYTKGQLKQAIEVTSFTFARVATLESKGNLEKREGWIFHTIKKYERMCHSWIK